MNEMRSSEAHTFLTVDPDPRSPELQLDEKFRGEPRHKLDSSAIQSRMDRS